MKRIVALGVGLFLAIVLLALPGCAPAAEEEYPTRPITFVCGWLPGGDSDTYVRLMAAGMEKQLGVPCVVVNLTGAMSTTQLCRTLLDFPPDGYTISEFADFHADMYLKGIKFPDPRTAGQILGFSAYIPTGFVVRADSKYETFQDFIDDCKARPGEVKVGVAGMGGKAWLGPTLMKEKMGIDFQVIVHDGSAPCLTDILSGRLELASFYRPVIDPYTGPEVPMDVRLRLLIVYTKDRWPGYEDVPTASEFGLDIDLANREGFIVHEDTPKDKLEILRTAFKNACSDPKVIESFETAGLFVQYKTPEEARMLVGKEYDVFKPFYDTGLIPKAE